MKRSDPNEEDIKLIKEELEKIKIENREKHNVLKGMLEEIRDMIVYAPGGWEYKESEEHFKKSE